MLAVEKKFGFLTGISVLLVVAVGGCQSFPFAKSSEAGSTPVAEREATTATPAAAPEQARGDLPRLMLQPKQGAGAVLEFAPVSLALPAPTSAATETPAPSTPVPTPEMSAPAIPQAVSAPETPPSENVAAPPLEGIGKLCPGDVLDVQCFSDPSLTRERTVRLDGCISLPIVQDVPVAGLTLSAAEDRIKEAYRVTFRDPQLSVTLASAVRRACTVLGDVTLPGRYPYSDITTLGQAIERAGGLRVSIPKDAPKGWMHKALVVRAMDEEGAHQALCFGLEQSGALDARIYPGDLVLVGDPTPLIYVMDGATNTYVLESRENMAVSEALAACGALRPEKGAVRGVEVLRTEGDTSEIAARVSAVDLLGGANVPTLGPGDVIRVLRKGPAASASGPVPVSDLSRRAAEVYYTEGLGVSGFVWLGSEDATAQPEATGQLRPSMRNLMKLLSGNP